MGILLNSLQEEQIHKEMSNVLEPLYHWNTEHLLNSLFTFPSLCSLQKR